MPLYDYKCGACEQVFEVRHTLAEGKPEKCPGCKKNGTLESHFAKAPAFHTFYSPMHPRRNRGIGNT